MSGHEFPGFALPDSPVFNVGAGTGMGAGEFPDVLTTLDLAMVFGSRLWGHDVAVDAAMSMAAPGVGDLYTHDLRQRACTALCDRVGLELRQPADDYRALVLHSGSEAVETAIKTAIRATGRTRIVAFEGGYHGTFGLALAVTHRSEFRDPWIEQLPRTVRWATWGEVPELDDGVACVVVEPWLGRAGVVPPPQQFLAALRAACDRAGAMLILDAVLCGAGRTGATIAEGMDEGRPDLLCLGKAIGSGYAASAVIARTDIATTAWDRGPVEPAHTSTSLGEPFACAGILRSLDQLESRAAEIEDSSLAWRDTLEPLAQGTGLQLRGLGLLWALDTGTAESGIELAARLRDEHRILVVPSGALGTSITIYPPVTSTDLERERFAMAVTDSIH